ncbi:hypothetical protein J7J47_11995 [Halomonas sp. ISL-60]|uniref:hypothetical protein n=1 Tax=Halomonas sp. ISL-56 TaxID=2819149 RepID=UPI001BEBCB1B|nr:hypothetical protein [Halomonas sp. ISL-56]MBT2772944.1 hypothetical protein [Halomonas sp. ISL-60]MBT2799991.1 hypothetical protein [Halomonas sp. ISL-56]
MNELPALTEAIVQDVVYAYCAAAKHEITVPNCGSVWGPEADIASMTKARLGHAFEIKVSRGDWLAELRQIRGDAQTAKWWRAQVLASAGERAKKTADMHAQGSNCCGLVPPNYFWMVTAPGIVKPDELPEYAGLMEIEPEMAYRAQTHGYTVRELYPAPRLHRVKLLDNQIMALARGVTLRYWQQRRNVA